MKSSLVKIVVIEEPQLLVAGQKTRQLRKKEKTKTLRSGGLIIIYYLEDLRGLSKGFVFKTCFDGLFKGYIGYINRNLSGLEH